MYVGSIAREAMDLEDYGQEENESYVIYDDFCSFFCLQLRKKPYLSPQGWMTVLPEANPLERLVLLGLDS